MLSYSDAEHQTALRTAGSKFERRNGKWATARVEKVLLILTLSSFPSTFRERRDQYLKLLERQVRRLQMSEAKLQHEADRLQFDLSRLNAKLAQYDAEIHLLRQSL